MTPPKHTDASEPDPWLGGVSLGVSAWIGGADLEADNEAGPPDWAGPLPDTPFVAPPAEEPASRSSSGSRGTSRGRGTFGEGGRGTQKGRGSRKARTSDGDDAPRARRERKPRPTPEEVVAAMSEGELEEYARTILLDQLTGQARSRKQLADKLAAKCVPDDLATRLLDRFEEVGLVDDEAFARMWIASRQPGKGLAGRALAQELRRKGIDDEIVKETVAEIDPEDEESAARRLLARKLRSAARLDRQVATRRLVGMLARKGYNSSLAFSLVREALDALEAGEEFDDGSGGSPAGTGWQ